MQVKPSPPQSDGYHMTDSHLIPPFAIRMVSLDCRCCLMEWNYQAPVDHFTKGCNLKQVQLDYFEYKRNKLHELISKLEQNEKLGTLEVSLMVTEKSFPVFGSIKWVEKKFSNNIELLFDKEPTI
jgi:hypothetical protein